MHSYCRFSEKLLFALLCIAGVAVIGYAALGPAKSVPRTGLGWQTDHFAGYFVFTWLLCGLWRHAVAVGSGATGLAVALEMFQGLTPDRFPDTMGAFYSISGVLCATLLVNLLRVNKRSLCRSSSVPRMIAER
jgi:hypothetical protein